MTVKTSSTVEPLYAGASDHQPVHQPVASEKISAAYQTGPLARDRVAQAYPVVREIAGALTLESWSDFVRSMVARKSLADSLLEAVHKLAHPLPAPRSAGLDPRAPDPPD